MPDFQTRDPSAPAFWDERFERGYTPWDRGGVPQALKDFASSRPRALVTLIPGCGSAYELAYLTSLGWDATAIDFSPAAVAKARQWAESMGGKTSEPIVGRIVEADFFQYAPALPLDLIYERAFLCALPRSMWLRVAERWAQLLAPGALLAGFFFFDEAPKGPPFGTSAAQLDSLLTPYFERIEDLAVSDSVPVFQGKERWQIWRRR